MRYHLRTLLIVLALAPPALAGAWATAQMEWTDELLLIVAVSCAIPYWLGIAALLAKNYWRVSAWTIAAVAAVLWPGLVLMSFLQLALAIPLWTVLLANGGDLSAPISTKTAMIAVGSTTAYFLWIAAVCMLHDG